MAELDAMEQAFRESLIQQEATENAFIPEPPEDSFGTEQAFQDEIDRGNALSSSLDQALPESPEETANVRELSRKTGFPEEAVKSEKSLFQEKARKQEITNLVREDTPATESFLLDPSLASVSHDEVESLVRIEKRAKDIGVLEDIAVGFERGELTNRLGILGAQKREGFNVDAQIKEIEAKLPELKGSGGFLEAAANALGTFIPNVPKIVETGSKTAALAAATAAVAGQAGPQVALPEEVVTVPLSAAGGFAFGATSEVFRQSAIVEGGLIYSDLLKEGVSEEVARPVSEAAGLVNGALEVVSFGIITAPIKKFVINLVKDRIVADIKKRGIVAAGSKLLKDTVVESAKVGSQEIATEVLQETSNIVASEVGKAIDTKELESRLSTDEGRAEILDQYGEVITETFKAMAVLGPAAVLPGTSLNFVNDIQRSANATQNEEVVKELAQEVRDTSLSKRDFQAAVEFQVKVLEGKKILDISIPVDKLLEFTELTEDKTSQEVIEEMGLSEQVEQAKVTGGDVRISPRQFAEFFTLSENFDSVSENIRLGDGEMTAAEAREFQESELPEIVEKAAKIQPKADITLEKGIAQNIPPAALRDKSTILFESDILDRETIEKDLEGKGGIETFEKLKESVKKEGIKDPVKVRVAEDGKVNVIDGSNRLLAAEELGLENVPVEFSEDSIKSGAAEKFVESLTPPKKELGEIESAVRNDIELAETEAGFKAMFESADEAGFTPKQYESYLTAVQRSADGRVKREILRREKAALKEATSALDEATIEMRRVVQEEVEQRPEYRALSILKDGGKLDQEAIFASDFLGRPFDLDTLKDFPKIGNKVIYGPVKKGQDVFHPDLLADIVGLKDGNELLRALFNARPINEVVKEEADVRILKESGELPKRIEDIKQTIEGLYVDDAADIIAMEMNALRAAQKQGKIKAALVKAAAKQEIQKYALRDISVSKFSRAAKRFGKQAGKLLRKNDRAGATKAKFLQLVNFYMAQQAFEVNAKIKKDQKFFKEAAKKPRLGGKKAQDLLPPDYSIAIRGLLNSHNLGGQALPQGFDLIEFQAKEFNEGVAFQLPEPGDGASDIRDLRLYEFNSLVNDLKTIRNAGVAKTKVLRTIRNEHAQEVVDKLVVKMADTMSPRRAKVVKDPVTGVELVPIKEEVLNKVDQTWQDWGVDLATLGFNMDTMLREIDGWEDLGLAYESIKGPIDDAVSNGYREGQVGYNVRHKQMLEDVEGLLAAHYTDKERSLFHRTKRVPGVSRELTHKQILAILLNSGNEENILALTGGDKKAITREELTNLMNGVEQKDLDYVQAVWDYVETYWGDIVESTVRRKNFKPEKVVAQPFEVKGKTYRGGYYPLRYDGDSLAINDVSSVDEIHDSMLFGAYTSEHTSADHIIRRKQNSKRSVDLDPFIMTTHLERVIYDLEVGEAVADSFKILHHKDFKAAFERMGRQNVWRAMDLWFRSTVTGEIRRGGHVERALRHMRGGITVVALGFNLGVAALQPLGIISAAIPLGKIRLAKSLSSVLGSVTTSGFKVFEDIGNRTPVMKERGFTFNKDINDFKRSFNRTWSDTGKVGRVKKLIQQGTFIAIVQMQKFADVVIWNAAYSKGMELFHNDDVKAKRYADRTVIRTQGSGNFQERTPVEQGTISRNINQTELVKAFSLFMVYFAAKNNVVYEAIKKNKKKSTVKGAAKLASDLALAFVWETLLVMLIKGHWPDEDAELDEKASKIAGEILSTTTAGVPFFREFVSSARGFAGGGTLASFSKDVARNFTQFKQGELDEGLALTTAKVLGVAAHIPTGQPIKTIRAINKKNDGDDVAVMEYILGPRFED